MEGFRLMCDVTNSSRALSCSSQVLCFFPPAVPVRGTPCPTRVLQRNSGAVFQWSLCVGRSRGAGLESPVPAVLVWVTSANSSNQTKASASMGNPQKGLSHKGPWFHRAHTPSLMRGGFQIVQGQIFHILKCLELRAGNMDFKPMLIIRVHLNKHI